MPVSAIIVAAGSSRRMGFDKLTAKLLEKPVLLHSVEAFLACKDVDQVIVVCPEERFECIAQATFGLPVIRVDGGQHRQDSVNAGIAATAESTTIVAIHDGARPLIRPTDISTCVEAAKLFGAATLARRVTETLKRSDGENFSRAPVDRNNLWFMETPQCFRLSVLRRAYENVREKNLSVTDEVSAVESLGISTKLIESSRPNIKITTPGDIELASHLIRQ